MPYTMCADLWCVTAYFNPEHYRTRRTNYELFANPIRAAGIPLLTVECAFGNDLFELPAGPDVLQVRSLHVLWQKERLINLGVANLPSQVTKVAWLDGDIVFTNPDWAVQTAAMLDEYPVVQPFAWAIRLRQGERAAGTQSSCYESFASVWQRDRSLVHAGGFDVHGHTGFAWAARRSLLIRHGLYEAALNANGDHLIAHAMAVDYDGPCMNSVTSFGRLENAAMLARRKRTFSMLLDALPKKFKHYVYLALKRPHLPYRNHFHAWAKPFSEDVQGQIGCTAGNLLHFWHGEGIGDRGHGTGRLALLSNGFNPTMHLHIGASGCLEWAKDDPRLQQWAREFFVARREDGK